MHSDSIPTADKDFKSLNGNCQGSEETPFLLKSPANAAHLAKSIKQYRKGQLKQAGLVDD